MKKLIASLTILATGAALASSVSSTATFGVLKITSSAKETAISVPWVEAGSSGSETIKVKDFVKTSNLTAGDLLLLYDPTLNEGAGGYKCWRLNNGAWVGTSVSYNNVHIVAGDDNETDDLLSRGQSIILVRNADPLNDTAIYLYGQYKSGTGSYVMVRSSDKVVKTLFAPVNTSSNPIYLNTQSTVGLTYVNWGTGANAPKDGDIITLQNASGNRFDATYKKGKWNNIAGDSVLVIQPGMGAWYSAVSGTANVTATLTTVE